MSRRLAIIAVVALTGCSHRAEINTIRFANRAPVWQVNDRLDVPDKPEERAFAAYLYHLDGFVFRNVIRHLDLPDPHRATNVNAVDEVPDSTWFVNRIGVRDMTVEEVRRGPNDPDGPEKHKPWTITGTKVGGASVGFLIKDARGVKYLLKFDEKGFPEIETAADVIVQRLLWAAGYHTPEDRIVQFNRDDLVIADDAKVKDTFGNKRPMTEKDLEERLAKINMVPGKPIRGLVSRFLPGIPIGGYPRGGVRKDDPNDKIPHQDRRDLRGMYVIASWVGHTDVKEGNTLDVWLQDPADENRHYVVHYLVDFGKSLGTLGYIESRDYSGFAYSTDFGIMFRSIFTLGIWKRPWEGIDDPSIPGIGLFEADYFEPDEFSTHTPYWPFHDHDRFDGFWGAKIVMRFNRAMIRAVVEEARYSDPRATQYMIETLVERQRKIGRYWFRQVDPLDRFTIEPHGSAHRLCFDDLWLRYRLQTSRAPTRYRAQAFDYDGHHTGWTKTVPGELAGRTCIDGVPANRDRADGYTIIRLRTERGRHELPGLLLHFARDPATGRLRLIGLRRN
jgi:hypothetical protein